MSIVQLLIYYVGPIGPVHNMMMIAVNSFLWLKLLAVSYKSIIVHFIFTLYIYDCKLIIDIYTFVSGL